VATAGGFYALAMAADNGLSYNAWSNPGALNLMVQWGAAAVAFFMIPAAMLVIWFARLVIREVSASGLTPGQVAVGEAVLMAGASYEWHKHNERVSERLTESVMGPTERRDPW